MITTKDKRWLSLANKLLKHSNHGKYQLGSVLVRGGSVISTGINKIASPKRFTNPHRPGMKLHAEIDCLLGIDKDSSAGSTLYISGLTKAGNRINTMPCQTCKNFCAIMGVKRIVFMNNHKIEEIK